MIVFAVIRRDLGARKTKREWSESATRLRPPNFASADFSNSSGAQNSMMQLTVASVDDQVSTGSVACGIRCEVNDGSLEVLGLSESCLRRKTDPGVLLGCRRKE